MLKVNCMVYLKSALTLAIQLPLLIFYVYSRTCRMSLMIRPKQHLSFIYVGYNLHKSVTLEDLINHFGSLSSEVDINQSSIQEKSDGKRSAKIAFTSEWAARECVERYNRSYLGSTLLVIKQWGCITPSSARSTYTVKISNIPSSVDEEFLRRKMTDQNYIPHDSIKVCQGNPNYAYVNCSLQANAASVASLFNGMKIEQTVLSAKFQFQNLSLTSGETQLPPTPLRVPSKGKAAVQAIASSSDSYTLPQKRLTDTSTTTVKVTDLAKTVTESQLLDRVQHVAGFHILNIIHTEGSCNYAYVNSWSKEACDQIIEILNGADISGQIVKAYPHSGRYEPKSKRDEITKTVPVGQHFIPALQGHTMNLIITGIETKHRVSISLPQPPFPEFISLAQAEGNKCSQSHPKSQWMWQNDKGSFEPFDYECSTTLEENYILNPGPSKPLKLTRSKWEYEVDFCSMIQKNTVTGKIRKIQRNKVDSDEQDMKQKAANSNQLNIVIKGNQLGTASAEKELMQYFSNELKTDELHYCKSLKSEMYQKITSYCQKHYVDTEFNESASSLSESVTVSLKGWSQSLSVVKDYVHKERLFLMENMAASDTTTVKVPFPTEWEAAGDHKTILKEVSATSEEFKKCEGKLHSSLPQAKILKIERIQNPWLWTKYHHHRELIKKKNGGVVREKELFHGTRQTDPSMIYQGEEGFDMRFSEQGLWGRGNYFAVNASYSDKYSFHPTPLNSLHQLFHLQNRGPRQLFLARVTIGDTHECSQDRSLRMPPQRPAKSGGLIGIERFDSVTGHTKGSKVYIIYDNHKAYPFYLITYT